MSVDSSFENMITHWAQWLKDQTLIFNPSTSSTKGIQVNNECCHNSGVGWSDDKCDQSYIARLHVLTMLALC